MCLLKLIQCPTCHLLFFPTQPDRFVAHCASYDREHVVCVKDPLIAYQKSLAHCKSCDLQAWTSGGWEWQKLYGGDRGEAGAMSTDELAVEDMEAVVVQLSRELQSSKATHVITDNQRAKMKELGLLVGRAQERVLELERQQEDGGKQKRST